MTNELSGGSSYTGCCINTFPKLRRISGVNHSHFFEVVEAIGIDLLAMAF